ncbi:MAG: transcription antitermination factor NusB [Acidimicrobiia bacterium]
MSPDPAPKVTIPARVTVAELASALKVDVAEVQGVLTARGEPCSTDDEVAGDLASAVARALGRALAIEPRDLALEALYQHEVGGEDGESIEMTGRVGFLVRGVLEHKEELDYEIESASEHWSVARMPVIDRTILRLGLFELRHSKDTPTGAVVAEAVRLAQTYSTERSGAFVNGVLASLARAARG